MNQTQRIDRPTARRRPGLVVPALACVLLTRLVLAAPEAQDSPESAPGVVRPAEQQLQVIILERYPQLLTQRFAGVSVVTALFNRDGTLAAIDLEISAKDPGATTVSELSFTRFGLTVRDLSYIGVTRFELPYNAVLVTYGGKRS
jgi:hypothetical protein